jgi:UDPglucose 6-dehydrogenase
MNIAVVGLGKLGIPLASVFSENGHLVCGIDVDKERIDKINARQNPLEAEPHIKITPSLSASLDYQTIGTCDMVFIVVNTPPSLPRGDLLMTDMILACENVCKHAKDGAIVVISSTLPPQTMDTLIVPIFAKRPDIKLVHNPFFIALGKVVSDLAHPDFVLLGGKDEEALNKVEDLWDEIVNAPIHKTSFLMAEMIKFSLTPYLTARINWANTLCEIAERISGIDVEEIIKVVGMDRRLNTKELHAGLPWGGDCYPKDVDSFIYFCNSNGIAPWFLESLVRVNEEWEQMVPKLIKGKINMSDLRKMKIAFLGISYKKGYPLLNQSTPYRLYEYFVKEEAKVFVNDPYISKLPNGEPTRPIKECLEDAGLVIIAVGYNAYRSIKVEDFGTVPIVDLCRCLEGTRVAKECNWLALGLTK